MTRANNFDAVRIVAALVVIFGHAHPLAAAADPVLLGNSVQGVAVKVFFVVSGFLVAKSWESDPNLMRYLFRRGLRLFPGLFLLLLLTVLVLGPALTSLSVGQYFSNGGAFRYFFYNMVLYPIYSLPGVFTENVYPNAVNGSLWSLPAEVLMYLLLPIAFLLTAIDKSRYLIVVVTATLCYLSLRYLLQSPPEQQIVVWGTGSRSVADVGPYFFIGAMYALTRAKVLLNPSIALFLIGLSVLFPINDYVFQQAVLMLVMPISVLAFANQTTPWISRFGRFGDPSYGIYLYGFALQQMLYHSAGPGMGPMTNAFISSLLAIAFGYASWHLLEKQALKLKPAKKVERAEDA